MHRVPVLRRDRPFYREKQGSWINALDIRSIEAIKKYSTNLREVSESHLSPLNIFVRFDHRICSARENKKGIPCYSSQLIGNYCIYQSLWFVGWMGCLFVYSVLLCFLPFPTCHITFLLKWLVQAPCHKNDSPDSVWQPYSRPAKYFCQIWIAVLITGRRPWLVYNIKQIFKHSFTLSVIYNISDISLSTQCYWCFRHEFVKIILCSWENKYRDVCWNGKHGNK